MQELWRVAEQNRGDFGGSRYLLDFQQREKRRNHVGTKKKYERLWMTSVPTDTTPPLPRVRRVGDAMDKGRGNEDGGDSATKGRATGAHRSTKDFGQRRGGEPGTQREGRVGGYRSRVQCAVILWQVGTLEAAIAAQKWHGLTSIVTCPIGMVEEKIVGGNGGGTIRLIHTLSHAALRE